MRCRLSLGRCPSAPARGTAPRHRRRPVSGCEAGARGKKKAEIYKSPEPSRIEARGGKDGAEVDLEAMGHHVRVFEVLWSAQGQERKLPLVKGQKEEASYESGSREIKPSIYIYIYMKAPHLSTDHGDIWHHVESRR